MIAPAPTASTATAAPAPSANAATAVSTATAAGAASPRRTTGLIGVPRARSARSRQPVAAAAHGLDQPVVAERLEREAQPADVDVDGALLDVDVITPHVVEQLRTRVHALGPREEEAQQAELGRSQRDGLAGSRHAVRRRIELQRSGREHLLRRLGRAPAQHGLDARLELA